jgi:hypothetical protein
MFKVSIDDLGARAASNSSAPASQPAPAAPLPARAANQAILQTH